MSTSQWKNDGELITSNTTDMNLNPGDVISDRTMTLDAGSNTIKMGGAVKFDGSGKITHTTANQDDVIGFVTPESSDKADNYYTVQLLGHVFAAQLDGQAGTSPSPGDVLIPSANDDGAWTVSDGGTGGDGGVSESVDTSSGDTYELYMNHPIALESGTGATTGGNLDGDVILAFYR